MPVRAICPSERSAAKLNRLPPPIKKNGFNAVFLVSTQLIGSEPTEVGLNNLLFGQFIQPSVNLVGNLLFVFLINIVKVFAR